MSSRYSPVVLSFLALAACAKKNKTPEPNFQPKSAEEALALLSAGHRAGLEKWKASVFKSCDANEALGEASGGGTTASIDMGRLAATFGDSLLVTGTDGQFALLGDMTAPAGIGTSSLNAESTVNGKTYKVQAEAVRNGSDCELKLYGQSVMSVRLASSVALAAGWNPARTDRVSASGRPGLVPGTGSSLSMLQGHAFHDAVRQGLNPTADQQKLLATRLGLAPEKAQAFFPLGRTSLGRHQFRLTGYAELDQLPAFNADEPRIVGPDNVTAALARGGVYTLELLTRIEGVKNRDQVLNPADSQLVRVQAEISVETSSLDSSSRVYLPRRLSIGTREALSDAEAMSCFSERNIKFAPFFRGSMSTVFEPSYPTVASPCRVLAEDFEGALLGTGTLASDIVPKFAGVRGSRFANYGGWNEPLRAGLLKLALANRDAAQELDSSRRAPIVQDSARYFAAFAEELNKRPNVAKIRDVFYGMGADWAFLGESVDSYRISDLVAVADHVGPSLPDSTAALLASFTLSPNQSGEILAYALSLSEEYKTLARGVQQSAAAIDMASWASGKLANALQNRIAIEQLRSWKGALDGALAFTKREIARTDKSSAFMAESNRKTVIQTALEEGWSEATYAALEGVADFARTSSFCERHKDASSAALCADRGQVSAAPGKMLSPAYEGRYGRLGAAFKAHFALLQPEFDYSRVRSDMNYEFFKPIWASCDNGRFEANKNRMNDLVVQLIKEKDTSRKWRLESDVRDLLNGGCR